MSSDCDDFVDADEVIVEAPVANGGGRERPKVLDLPTELNVPQIALFPASPKATSSPNGKPEAVASRRNRLLVLRNRMHSEFGSELSDGSASESTSLASWGRNLLSEKFDCSRSEGGFPRVCVFCFNHFAADLYRSFCRLPTPPTLRVRGPPSLLSQLHPLPSLLRRKVLRL